MISKTLIFHEVKKDGMPEKSGEYLVVKRYEKLGDRYMDMPFSKKHNAFNTEDYEKTAETAVEVDMWAELPNFYEVFKNDETLY